MTLGGTSPVISSSSDNDLLSPNIYQTLGGSVKYGMLISIDLMMDVRS